MVSVQGKNKHTYAAREVEGEDKNRLAQGNAVLEWDYNNEVK